MLPEYGWKNVLGMLVLLLTMATGVNAQTKVTISSLAGNPNYLPLWVAQEQKLFQKHGLDAMVELAPPSQARSVTVSQLGVVSLPAVIAAAAEGREQRVLMLLDQPRQASVFVGRPGLHSPEDLRGKRIGVTALADAAWVQAMMAFDYFGMDPAANAMSFVEVGGAPGALAQALESGAIDAAVLDGARAAPLRAKGFTLVLDFATTGITGIQNALVADAGWLRANANVAERAMAALLDATAFALAPANEQRAKEILGRAMNLSASPSALETGYRAFAWRANRRAEPILDAALRVQKVMARADAKLAEVRLDALVEPGIARKLDDGGSELRGTPQFGGR